MEFLPRPRVLVADDEPDLRTLLKFAAVGAPFEVCFCEDGEDALQQYKKGAAQGRPFAGVVLDVEMPGYDGIRTAKIIRETDPALPIALLTVHDEAGTRINAKGLGVSAYWVKPFVPADLVSCISQWLHEQSFGPSFDTLDPVG
ncbi:MAG TPA: response regulator [Abditibacteriaceae bacterium]|jgi:two-component system OmpR family response regulator